MIKTIISDLSRVILFPKDESYRGGLNDMHDEKSQQADYDFWQYYKVNDEILELYNRLNQSLKVYIFTSGHIQNHPPLNRRLKDNFTAIHSAEDINIKKDSKESYVKLLEILTSEPSETLLIDDTVQNIEAAREAGLNTIRYENNAQLFEQLKKYEIT